MSGGAQGYALFEYPRSLAFECANSEEFARQFGTEKACEEFLRRGRWPRGFSCPKCAGHGRWLAEKRGYQCHRCRKFCSLIAGTILQGTRKPLKKWFDALFLVVQRGVNARTLQREIGLTYKVAWMWGHKLRSLLAALAVPEDVRPRERKHVTYEAEREQGGPTPRRPDPRVPGPCGCSRLIKRDWCWIDNNVKEPSRYELPTPVDFAKQRRIAIFAHWELLATYWGSVGEKHLRAYLDELAFRMNRARRAIAESFLEVVPGLATAEPLPYKAIVAKPALEPGDERRITIFVPPTSFGAGAR